MHEKNTKIVCTLGPSSDSVKEILGLAKAGMNVARLNFSHGTYEHHSKLITNVHKVEKILGIRIGILQDLQGPKIRIGQCPKEGIEIKKDEKFILSIKQIQALRTHAHGIVIPVRYKGIIKDAKKNTPILINDGLFEALILEKKKTGLICVAKTDGVIKTGNGLNLPMCSISAPAITEKDKEDLKFGLSKQVDFIALSFVKSEKDIKQLKKLTENTLNPPQIIAKVERHEAVKHLKEIIKTSDAVMVARGDLGVDIAPEQVPIVQKKMISLANKYGKPIITATQVLQSMVKNPTPTRAEISDAANAVFDHTDAIMLSNESAVGKYPVRAAVTLTKVALAVENELKKDEELRNTFITKRNIKESDAAYESACDLARETNSDAIIVFTKTGDLSKQIAKYRMYIPIITITDSEKTARKLTLVWGINKVFVKKLPENDFKKQTTILNFLQREKTLKKGSKVILILKTKDKNNTISTHKL
ncbi:pyruvate kinase [Candidatus Peregrinibacteria bacterium]|nr:pyruvate kinase [Candidatus Peregrinibacteria bacterium]